MLLAVFDLDHTLIRSNIAFELGKYLYRRRCLGFFRSVFLVFAYLFYKVGCLSVPLLHRLYDIYIYRKLQGDAGTRLVDGFLKNFPQYLWNQALIDAFKRAKHSGAYTLLLSSSPAFLVEPIGRQLGTDLARGTTYSKNSPPNVMDGAGKARAVTDFAKMKKIPLREVAAYSDSIQDLPMLRLVGKPVAVSPGFRFRAACRRYGIEIF